MKKLLSVILIITMLLSTGTVVLADGIDGPMQKAKIKVGINAQFPPFEYYDENGELYGFDIDLMNYIGERLGFEIEYIDMPFDKLFPAVIKGEVDCAISAISITEERNNVIDYTIPYLSARVTYSDGEESDATLEQYAILFPNNSAEKGKLAEAAGVKEKSLYNLINGALSELIEDKTIEKLGEKCELNNATGTDDFDYEYTVMPVPDGFDKSNMDKSELSSVGQPSATSVPYSEWAKSDIEKAIALNIINGGGNYNFTAPITREEFCELIYNYCSMVGKLTLDDGHKQFKDTDNVKIGILNTMGIINGKSETEFAPNDLLTREEAATILNRLINAVHPDLVSTEMYFEFEDNSQISDWAMGSIQRICNMGIMKGVGNNTFSPRDRYTTEQSIVTIVRVYANSGITEAHDITFADSLDKQMPKDKNYMFSPISIKMALALASNGASGETKTEILNALKIASLDEFNKSAKDLIERYSQTDILSLNVANSIWINKDKTNQQFSDGFKGIATEFYKADVNTVDRAYAVSEINSWVNDKTKGKIPLIIENADDFWVMLINAIYFKGAWQDEFNEKATAPDEFTSADGTKAELDFMNKTKWFPYAEAESVKMLELPYKNRVDKISDSGEYLGTEKYDNINVSMYLILAENDVNIEHALNEAIKNEQFNSTYIKLSVPKFKVEYEATLNDILKNMGIVAAFDEHRADFTEMFNMGNMWFTNTIHKTYISVDEKGTEAAAITAIGMAGSSLPPKPIELKFNKPFYFVIRDNTSGETLFMGKFAYGK